MPFFFKTPLDEHRVTELAHSYIDTLVELMRDGQGRARARDALLDRGWAKGPEGRVVTGTERSYLGVLRVVNEDILSKRNETQT